MDVEQGESRNTLKKQSWKTDLAMVYQSFGVVFGDLSLSPLYVYECCYVENIEYSKDDIFGVLSVIIWTLTLVPLFKYVLIVLRADDNGEGGTFALYSLLCRHSNIWFLPNIRSADLEFSTDKTEILHDTNNVSRAKSMLGKSKTLQFVLFVVALFGSSMVIGDGVLIPAITVFSAARGLKNYIPVDHEYWVVCGACFILICLFALQHFGTHRLGFMFAPIVMMWLVCISILGLYNIFTYRGEVYHALSPYYVYKFISNLTRRDWRSLGSILLCITGSEAMFAALGHFSRSSIKIAFIFMVYPALILAYMGQAAYHLNKSANGVNQGIDFYASAPANVRKIVTVIAILASIVGSQAIITGTFSMIHQALAIGCFPRVKVVHTSNTVHGQIYIPEINWILMILSLVVTIGFREIRYLANASGLAVISVMLVSTFLTSLVIIICWRKSVMEALGFLILFGSIEIFYFSASLLKIFEGAWVPVVFSIVFMTIMCVWQYVKVKKYEFELKNKLPLDWFLKLVSSLGMVRVPGIGLVYSELASGIPAMFLHLVTNMPSFHQVLVFVSIKALSVPHVPPEERYLVGRCGPKEHRIYRCIIRYGYRDNHNDHDILEDQLVYNIKEFISSEASDSCSSKFSSPEGKMTVIGTSNLSGNVVAVSNSDETEISGPHRVVKRRKVTFVVPSSPEMDPAVTEELQELLEASESGNVFILGHSRVQAQRGSSLLKRFSINVVYNFLKSNFRWSSVALNVPHATLLDVGMVYSV